METSSEELAKLQTGREKIEWYSKQGSFVFHGSALNLSELEPRQQMIVNEKTGKTEPDGEPAVCATGNPDIAMFKAIFNKQNCQAVGLNGRTKFGVTREGKANIGVFRSLKDFVAKEKPFGYVYVFPKEAFIQHPERIFEFRAYRPIKPIDVVQIETSDINMDEIKIL